MIFPEFIALIADEDFLRRVVSQLVRFDHTDVLVVVVGQKFFIMILGWTTVDNDSDVCSILSIAPCKQVADVRLALTRSQQHRYYFSRLGVTLCSYVYKVRSVVVTFLFSMSLNRDSLDVSESLLCRAVKPTDQFLSQALLIDEDTGSSLLARLLTPDDRFHSFVSEPY